MSKSWVSTLKLPKSTFPPRPLPELRPLYLQRCADTFYKWQEANRPARDPFVIHDGPPYANGSLHVGHALNKILKDIILRVQVQQGRRVKYIPGWDCHGLPIELKALGASSSGGVGGKSMPPVEIRKAARALASRTVLEQMAGFRSYGVMGDWDRRWTTMDPDYEVKQLRLFQRMVHRGLIYRKYKPVYWSPSSRTALAEAELEYNENHVSTAAYVKLPIANGLDFLGEAVDGLSLFAVIWTTTPWTLPANKAIAIHKDMDYTIVKVGNDALLVAEPCLESLSQLCFGGVVPEVIVPSIKGEKLVGVTYTNPLQGATAQPQPVIHADFVTAGSGSGLVHNAPGHGFEDYDVCMRLGLPVAAPVDGDGLFTAEAYPEQPSTLEGLHVQKEGNGAVLKLLGDNVLATHEYQHKYPYDWRTKQPIIVRATAQWFADVATIKDQSLEALESVRFIPESGKNRLESFVKGRSEWCISRQRAWGVPIPALYDTNGEAILTEESVEHIVSVIQARGSDAWWSDDADELAWIPESLRGNGVTYRRGTDTMDVWFDSGSSWTQAEGQADVYLEGSDQHRGWFQSSLLTRVAALDGHRESTASLDDARTLSPFKTLITHGFTLDAEGKKMSKSLGNIISPDQVMNGTLLPPLKLKKKEKTASGAVTKYDALGPDALRLWASGSEYTKDVVMGEPVLKAIHASLIKYRTIIKMLLGSMHESARTAPLTALDHIAILQLRDAMEEVGRAYANYEFNKAVGSLNRWVTNDLSAFYLEALKDRLYCADGGGVLEPIFSGFMRMLAPITPVLVEEAWDHAPAWLKEDPSVAHPLQQLYASPVIDPSRLSSFDEAQLRRAIPMILSAHAAVKAASELARNDKFLGSSLQCSVVLEVPNPVAAALLQEYAGELEAMFVVSSVAVNPTSPPGPPDWKYRATFDVSGPSDGVAWVLAPEQAKCPRCWRYVAPKEDHLCQRCEEVVDGV